MKVPPTQAGLSRFREETEMLKNIYGQVSFHIENYIMTIIYLTLFEPGFFGSLMTRGGHICPPPTNNGGNGWKFQKLSWNLISYRDWCRTKEFTTFRYLEPSQLMVWKSGFFWWFMRFVRVPPYESWANWTNFFGSWENGEFFGVKPVVPSSTLKMRKRHKKIGTCICIHTRI